MFPWMHINLKISLRNISRSGFAGQWALRSAVLLDTVHLFPGVILPVAYLSLGQEQASHERWNTHAQYTSSQSSRLYGPSTLLSHLIQYPLNSLSSLKICASLGEKQHLILICMCLITSKDAHFKNSYWQFGFLWLSLIFVLFCCCYWFVGFINLIWIYFCLIYCKNLVVYYYLLLNFIYGDFCESYISQSYKFLTLGLSNHCHPSTMKMVDI